MMEFSLGSEFGAPNRKVLFNPKKMEDVNCILASISLRSARPTALPGAEMTRLAFKRPLAFAVSAACMIEAVFFPEGGWNVCCRDGAWHGGVKMVRSISIGVIYIMGSPFVEKFIVFFSVWR